MYRGIKLNACEVADYAPGSKIQLPGYTSTSKQFEIAHTFAFNKLKDHEVPVIFEIIFNGNSGLFELTQEFSAYPEECEVLLQDGLEYRILSNEERENSDN